MDGQGAYCITFCSPEIYWLERNMDMNIKEVVIKSFNGIGDLLFVTPTIRKIKEKYPEVLIVVNTNHPELVIHNPFVDEVNRNSQGIFLGYADPIHCKDPTIHHILSDWMIVKKATGLEIELPYLKPEIWMTLPEHRNGKIGVQVIHKGHWHKKKVWPYFDELATHRGFEPIPKVGTTRELIQKIATYKAVVCAEGGISHIAKAVGTPAVVIFGGFAAPIWSGYIDHINMTNKIWCSYCYNQKPCLEEDERLCMKDIKIWQVENAVEMVK